MGSKLAPHAQLILAILIVLQNSAVMAVVLLGLVPAGVSTELLFAIVNMGGTAQGYALSYFFGSSAGSADKNAALSQLARKQP